MKRVSQCLSPAVLACALVSSLPQALAAAAQGLPAPKASAGTIPAVTAPAVPSQETLEPAVETSRAATMDAPTAAAPTTAAASGAGAADRTSSGVRRAASSAAASAGRSVLDRLELDATQITGNRELPRVLYIVPWKRADLGDLTGKPVNSLLDEVLSPIDRDVFRRETRYFEALQAAPAAGAAAPEGKAAADGTLPPSPSGDSVRAASQATGTDRN